jgi:hypothetical protein
MVLWEGRGDICGVFFILDCALFEHNGRRLTLNSVRCKAHPGEIQYLMRRMEMLLSRCRDVLCT